ncbi:MAG: acetyl-CoA decarbonylase/synthase complex subunit delta [Proteobacteria bacterium]|nr:acetyl-CoA decarbonylase/synthase complex subunit delta [Desulfobacteraceae bacterium]MBU2522292.1 acetyl-CoA decarbonylase/synthase complex subunit delta [Pseudomonadota bacterium]MBU3980405.1 acetyl-CoA decarbonylase/synthase complex subunit delta [Pseudomonadota bacterium]MBU4013248.1 acetyl-CoA decarbonylase/synthase complex subunit delta [Pseudomonadota bacterium]MBU4067883.1 acetyl-CoA decarbonylase/synthase complex subunit delta [Pseudomonadota bacterium]
MAFEVPKVSYTGKIREIPLGREGSTVTVGGESCYSFHLFEGEMPYTPKIAMEVYDSEPEDWSDTALEPFADVIKDPVAWARKCIDTYGAEMIALQLASTDPNDKDISADEAAKITKKVADAVEVPLIVWGCANVEKDTEVLKAVCEVCEGKNLIIGPVVEGNYRAIGAAAIAYKHTVVASTPIDINLAKQLNILLGNLNVPDEKIIIDPSTGALGYGLEYCYSVMERIRMAALVQEDERLQFPIISNLAKEVWKTKEVKVTEAEAPLLGDLGKRGILMEALTAQCVLLAGANILVMRHPEAISLVKQSIKDLMTGK